MHIRDTTIDDVRAFCEIRKELFPWQVSSLAAQEAWYRTSPPAGRPCRLAAEIDGQIVGFTMGGLNTATSEQGAAWFTVAVMPEFQHRGVGSALLERMQAHLRSVGAKRSQAWAKDDSKGFAERNGYTQGASLRYSAADVSALPPVPELPAGVTLATAREIGPDVLYELDVTAFADEPGDIPNDAMSKHEWVERLWNAPDLDLDCSLVALVDGVAASLTFIEINRETGRAWASGTSTLREFRGRGLAKLAKSVSLRKAAEAGVTQAFTSNDYTNAPMLAINDWLGYKVIATQWSYLKDVSC